MDSILTSIKSMLGLSEEDTSFDIELIMHINAVFSILTQLGVGSSSGFKISDKSDLWIDFCQDTSKIEMVKTYVYMKTKLIFDPTTGTAVAEASNRIISELENRLFMEFNFVNNEVKDE